MTFLLAPFQSAWQHRKLLKALSVREINTNFKGSFVGLGWLVLQPLASLAVYWLVFGEFLNPGGGFSFVSQLFTGLIILQAFSQPVSRAPRLVLARPSYVTKVVFPLDILPWPVLALASVQAITSTVMLLVLHTAFVSVPDWTALALPVVIGSVLLIALSMSWVLSSIGVYVRDTQEIVRVVVQMLFFLSPMAWRISEISSRDGYETVVELVMLNPLAIAMEASRHLIDNAHAWPGWWHVSALLIGSLLFASFAHAFFRRTKDGFADVL